MSFLSSFEFSPWNWPFLLLIVSIAAYIYIQREASFFKRKGIKNVPYDYPLVGNMFRVLAQKEHFKDVIYRVYNAFPDQRYVGYMQINKPLYMIRDLELIKQATIKDFDHFLNHQGILDEESDPLFGCNLFALKGDKWRDMRATLSPAFTSSKMRNMFEFVVEIGEQMTEFYLQKMKEPENSERGLLEIEMKDAFTRYANDVIASSAFGIKVNSLAERDNSFYEMGKKASDFSGIQMVKFFLFSAFPKLMKMTGIKLFRKSTSVFFRSLVLDSMSQREQNHVIRHDMIQILMDARKGNLKYDNTAKEEKDTGFAVVEESQVGKQSVKRNWNDNELVAQAVLFFIAGFETASTLLCFIAHQLAICPDIQKKLQDEIDAVVAEDNEHLDYNALAKMKYMDMVVSETLRLWPPAIATDRECVKAYKFPAPDASGKEYLMKPGEVIWVPIYGIHRDPKYYPNPEEFDPERFSDENKSKINPLAFLPFGIGPRNCIGSRFALMEAKAVIFHLLAKFDFVETAKTDNPIQIANNTFNLHSKNGFWIGLKPRQ